MNDFVDSSSENGPDIQCLHRFKFFNKDIHCENMIKIALLFRPIYKAEGVTTKFFLQIQFDEKLFY